MPPEKYLILSLALENAIARENWPEVTTLFDARAEGLDTFGSVPEDLKSQILAVDERLTRNLLVRRREILSQMRQLKKVSRARNTYSTISHS